MDQDDIRIDGDRMSRAQLIEDIRRDASDVGGRIGSDFLLQRINHEAIETIQEAFDKVKGIPDRKVRIAMLTSLEGMSSCALRTALNAEIDQTGPRMIERTLRLSGLILIDVEHRLKAMAARSSDVYWSNAGTHQKSAEALHYAIGGMLRSESEAEDRERRDCEFSERWDAEIEDARSASVRRRRSLVDLLLKRRPPTTQTDDVAR